MAAVAAPCMIISVGDTVIKGAPPALLVIDRPSDSLSRVEKSRTVASWSEGLSTSLRVSSLLIAIGSESSTKSVW